MSTAVVDRLEFAPPATPGLIRALLLALLAHGLLLLALTWSIQWKQDTQTASFEAELWSALPTEAAPALPPELPPALPPEPLAPAQPPEPPPPEPEPEPAPALPAPEPVPPPKVDIALQQEKLRLEKLEEKRLEALRQEKLQQAKKLKLKQEQARQERLKQEKLAQDKLRQEKLPQDKRTQAQADKTRQDALDSKQAAQQAKMLEAQREKNLARMAGLAGGSGAADATGSARKSSGPSAGYAGRIRARIKPNIVFTEDISGNPTAEVEVRTSPDGTIVGRKLLKSSGVTAWDEAVLKAIDKTEVLPRDIDGTMPNALLLVFRPKD